MVLKKGNKMRTKMYEIYESEIHSHETGFPTHRFRIVDSVPSNYTIWNVCGDILPDGYIPLCRLSAHQPFTGARNVDTDALLAVKAEGSKIIMGAIGCGPDTLKTMEAYVEKNRRAKSGTYEYNAVKRMKEALPYMRKITWE